jgi:DNA-binding Lrp family transcriptional regulator
MTTTLDRRLVAALCRNGRADVDDIAAAVDAAATTVEKRLRALEDRGAIRGYAARIDYDALGYQTVLFQLGVDFDAIDAVADRLRSRPAFGTVYRTSGREGVFAVGRFESEAAIGACLRELHDDGDVRWIDADRVVSTHRDGGCPIPER